MSRIMQQNVTKLVYPFSTSCLHLYFILMNMARIDSNYLGKKAQQAHFLATFRPLLQSGVALATLYLLVLHTSYPLHAQQIDSLLRLGQMDAAIRMSDSIIASRKASPEEKFNALIAGGYSASLIYRTNNPISLPYFLKALEIAKSQNQYQWECQALAFIGSYYVRCLHQPALGLQYHEQARQIALLHNDSAILAGAHNNLGVIYSENYHDSLALLHFSKAISLSNEEAGGQYAAENNIGAVLMRDEKYQEAISYFLLAQSHMERNNITENMTLSFKNIGECYHRMGDFTTAESWANRCLHLAQETNDTAFQVYSLLLLSDIALGAHQAPLARTYCQTALNLGRLTNSATLLASCYASLSQLMEHTGQYHQALSLLHQQAAIHDSIERVEKRIQIEQLNEVNQQIATHNALLRSMQQLEKRNGIWTAVVIALITCTFVAVTFLLVKIHQRKHRISALETENAKATAEQHQMAEKSLQQHRLLQKTQQELNDEIERKHREIADYALLVENKNQLLLLAIHEIEQRRNDFKIKNREAMDLLLAKLRANVHIEKEWDSFKLHFENVHPEFFSRLLEHSPSLTPDDLRFCACLRLNLSSKDIARLFNISPEAVRQRIYRIRKKLNFATNTELMNFIMNL